MQKQPIASLSLVVCLSLANCNSQADPGFGILGQRKSFNQETDNRPVAIFGVQSLVGEKVCTSFSRSGFEKLHTFGAVFKRLVAYDCD